MPQIVVVTDSPQDSGRVVYRERVASSCMESEHFSRQLTERLGWAVSDADALELDPADEAPAPAEELDEYVEPVLPRELAVR
jgi:hypothetical protein